MVGSFFDIEMLPARHGDAIWIEYGDESRTRRIMIDGGPIQSYPQIRARLDQLPDGDKRVELVVITHVDTDHVEGVIRLFAEPKNRWPIAPKAIWFNGWRHISEAKLLGGREGEFISALIHERAFDLWNKKFAGKAVMVPDDGPLPVVKLTGGMTLTLLSPDVRQLKRLEKKWRKDVDKWQIAPGDLNQAWEQLVEVNKFKPSEGILGGSEDFQELLRAQLKTDSSRANGASIAFLAEFDGKSCIFLGDAHVRTINESLQRLLADSDRPLKVDAVKMSHHGSKNNVNEEFFGLVDARKWLISTNGGVHGHPNKQCIDAVVEWSQRKPEICFNYRSDTTAVYADEDEQRRRGYDTRYPLAGEEGIRIRL